MDSKRQSSSLVGAQAMPPFKESIELCWNYCPLDENDHAVLKRWLEHPDAEKIWSAIRAHSEHHGGPVGVDAPIRLIIFVLQVKKEAERESELNAKVAAITAELKKLQTKKTREVDREAKKVPFEKRADVWERAGNRLRLPPLDIPRPRVRSDRNGSRARTYFIRDVSGFIHDVTDKWLDQQVAVLTEIAFNTRDIISEDTVRKARSE